ncbi:MAG: hypothetical protein KA229_10260 [Chitinophagaceae bacterium]|nr:hypothetical protein [Chitinophagaceae bacterium]
MKKMILAFTLLVFSVAGMAQQDIKQKELANTDMKELASQKGLSNIPKCFCCDNAYNLPVPPISGPKIVKCGDTARFVTADCAGAKYSWSVNPNINFQQNGNGITIFPPVSPGTYTITLKLQCGKAVTSNTYTFTVEKPAVCNPSFTFTYTLLGNGYVNINTIPDASTQVPGTEHWWGIQYNGTHPNCNTCAPIPFTEFNNTKSWGGYINPAGVLIPYMGTGLTKGTSGYGINYSGFPNNSCVRITHYIKCCGETYRQTQCVSFTTVNGKMAKPVITESKVEYLGHVTLLK